MNMTQANPYCFEFKFNRMNPLNLTNEDFGEIQIYSSTYRRDPQQRSREFFRQFKLTQIATILPNETYVSLTSSDCFLACLTVQMTESMLDSTEIANLLSLVSK